MPCRAGPMGDFCQALCKPSGVVAGVYSTLLEGLCQQLRHLGPLNAVAYPAFSPTSRPFYFSEVRSLLMYHGVAIRTSEAYVVVRVKNWFIGHTGKRVGSKKKMICLEKCRDREVEYGGIDHKSHCAHFPTTHLSLIPAKSAETLLHPMKGCPGTDWAKYSAEGLPKEAPRLRCVEFVQESWLTSVAHRLQHSSQLMQRPYIIGDHRRRDQRRKCSNSVRFLLFLSLMVISGSNF